MKNLVFTSAVLVAALLPIFLIARWRHRGLLAAVLLGWSIVHVCNISFRFEEPVDAVFTGLWVALGWLFMLVWCLPIYGIVLLVGWRRRRSRAYNQQGMFDTSGWY